MDKILSRALTRKAMLRARLRSLREESDHRFAKTVVKESDLKRLKVEIRKDKKDILKMDNEILKLDNELNGDDE